MKFELDKEKQKTVSFGYDSEKKKVELIENRIMLGFLCSFLVLAILGIAFGGLCQ